MKKVGFFIVLVCAVCFYAFAAAAENFYIENYEVVLEVSKSRLVHVKEAITAQFTSSAHGIIRKIPTTRSSIKNLRVSEPFSSYNQVGELDLKIGEANRLISGKKVYHIEYDHQLYSNSDDFYYNIVGTGWGVPIHKVRFAVKMPDKVEDGKVGLSIGYKGTRGFDGGAEYTVSGNEIWGQTFRTLAPHEGITLRAEVPEGYFDKTHNKKEYWGWFGLLLCTLLSFLTWYQYGKDEHVTPVVTFEAPKGITGAEAELILSEKITDKGLIALIINLANGGYFKIKSERKKFTLYDFKPYDGYNDLEQKMMLLLEARIKDGVVTDDMLKKSAAFYRAWSKFKEDSSVKEERERYYEKTSISSWRNFMMFIYICGNILLTFCSLMNYEFNEENIVCIPVLFFIFVFFVIVMAQHDIISKIIGFIFCAPLLAPVAVGITIVNPAQVIMGVACAISSMICYAQMMKPNLEGRMVKGKLLGLKHFIEVAEKKRLEMMVEQNPQYFYKILPYAYVLGVSNVWIRQFEGIAVPPPQWDVDNVFMPDNFNNFTRGFNAVTAPSVDNGGISRSSHTGSSGGGGFSGGGFGGGGGSSW